MIKESTHVKGTNIGLDSQDYSIVGRKIEPGDRPQEEAGNRPKPLGHGSMSVTKGRLDTSREGFRNAQNSVNAKGHGLADAKSPFDSVLVGFAVTKRHVDFK